jgi:hypothetical protein
MQLAGLLLLGSVVLFVCPRGVPRIGHCCIHTITAGKVVVS